ncbi:hypothetical protein DE146DRAFT_204456 [Phaeosphaeria sp. MPI-PUGE-AT-0046c]|nr:hypothetical protein DE146DRAFT_204456 [Phaeosphaeria sp. MPI-PUGE-AT-0046c]
MPPRLKVAVVGATGETGASIMNALLENPENFEVLALVRQASVDKQAVVDFAQRGVIVKTIDLSEATDTIVPLLIGLDVVVCCLTLLQAKEETALIEACSKAKVGRYVPSFFGPVCPSRGVMMLREMKENNLDVVKRLYLPYTVIDVGWWYQLALPELPSGKLQTKKDVSLNELIGDGNTPFALIDNRDIGKFVTRIIADPRTLNKKIFCYNEISTSGKIWDLLEELSGEKIPRVYARKEDLEAKMSRASEILAKSFDAAAQLDLGIGQYMWTLGIRGDNVPKRAKYLGYMDARELYPDIKITPLASYIEGRLSGTVRNIYEGRKFGQ